MEAEIMEAEENKAFSFRKLNTTDLFLLVKIISKIGINEFVSCMGTPQVTELIKKVSSKNDSKSEPDDSKDSEFIVGAGIALEFANKVLIHLPDCQTEICTLLGNVSGMSAKTVELLDAEIFFEMVIAFVKKDEFPNFIRVASKYFK